MNITKEKNQSSMDIGQLMDYESEKIQSDSIQAVVLVDISQHIVLRLGIFGKSERLISMGSFQTGKKPYHTYKCFIFPFSFFRIDEYLLFLLKGNIQSLYE